MKHEIRCAIELRADESRQSPGLLEGVLLTYETRATDRPELFKRGALYWADDGLVLNESHDTKQVISRFMPQLDGDQVRVSLPLPDTQRGRDAATLIRNGTMKGLSVEFRAESEKYVGGVREIHRAFLVGAGLVTSASYKSSTVEVRGQKFGQRRFLWR